ncbi:MAG: endonuclease/exonuclease/phosphatase family protein [Bdellovibrionaceae bacterium]|nr:endonuclease/exonuclease/phosphatase family protein [Pseudobdellovibrionaceae bacterium]
MPVRQLSYAQPFTISVWNIHKEQSHDFSQELNALFDTSDALCLQEVELTEGTLAHWATFDFAKWFMAPAWETSRGPTGTAVLSKFQVERASNLISERGQPITATPKSSLVVYLPIEDSDDKLMVISTHALNFTFMGPFRSQLEQVAALIRTHNGPVVWSGDFNTWNPSRWDYLFELTASLGLQPVPIEDDQRWLVLDHVFQRGLTVLSAEELEGWVTSDHKPCG